MQTETLSIGGMTCAACAGRIEKAVRKLTGVNTATVNLASEKLFVEYQDTKTLTSVKDTVVKIGYQVLDKPHGSTVTIPIGGMTCAACAQRIEKAIRKLEGIETATVNLATEKATVIYNPQVVRISAIKEAIEKAGYTALDFSKDGAVDEDKLRKEKEINQPRRRADGVWLVLIGMDFMRV